MRTAKVLISVLTALMLVVALTPALGFADGETAVAWGPLKRAEFGVLRNGTKAMGFDFETGKAGTVGSKLGKYDVRLISGDRFEAREIGQMIGDYGNLTSLDDADFQKRVPAGAAGFYLVRTDEDALVMMKVERILYGSDINARIMYAFAVEPEPEVGETFPTTDIGWTDEREVSIGDTRKGYLPLVDFDKLKVAGSSDLWDRYDLRINPDDTLSARKIAQVPLGEWDDLDSVEEIQWKQSVPLLVGPGAYVMMSSEGRWVKFKTPRGIYGSENRADLVYVISMLDDEEPSKVGAMLGVAWLDEDMLALVGAAFFTFLLAVIAKNFR